MNIVLACENSEVVYMTTCEDVTWWKCPLWWDPPRCKKIKEGTWNGLDVNEGNMRHHTNQMIQTLTNESSKLNNYIPRCDKI